MNKVSQDSHLGELTIALPSASEHALKVTTLAVFHHNIDLVLTGDKRVQILDYVGALAQAPMNVNLVQGLESFSFRHVICLKLFDNQGFLLLFYTLPVCGA